jgi:hypothetical protein
MKDKIVGVLLLILLLSATGCGKESQILDAPPLSDYYPLQTGKIFIYRLDSTVLGSFGSALIVKSFLAKDSVEASFTDNQGRLSYRIFRLIRDTAGLQPWQPSATYVATATKQAVEYVDNNFRFIKMRAPLVEGNTWKGHSYIDTKSLNTTVGYLDEWQYEYRNVGKPFQVFNTRYDSTATVFQQDETTPSGPFNPGNYQQRNLGTEVYAKGIGLIYKEFLHWTWQVTPPPAKYEDGSYGVKLRLISHY